MDNRKIKRILVCGAGGFIGSHLVKYLKNKEKCFVVGVDLKYPEYCKSSADEFIKSDLRDQLKVDKIFEHGFDETYQLAANMGGAGYLFTGKNDADVILDSALINLNIGRQCKNKKIKKIFFSSSACVYPIFNQQDEKFPKCAEESAYPALPDSEYGWEKIFSERLYLSLARNYGVDVRIARFHNIFGPEGSWNNGKEKAPAAICRKVAEALDGGEIEIWGDGEQTRSFLYIDECLEGIDKFMSQNKYLGPLNIGSEEMVSINKLAEMIIKISGKKLQIKHISGPVGVRGRNSDNKLIREILDWEPNYKLEKGLEKTYFWIKDQLLTSC
jgi:nucleoside-diphosphate-sugar epimerase